jgi:hypothetical protein
MLIPLGILAASGAGVASDYELITTQILGSNTDSVTFSSLGTYSSTYKHLQMRAVVKSSSVSQTLLNTALRINGNSGGSDYSYHRLSGNGSSVSSQANFNGQDRIIIGSVVASGGGGSVTTNQYGVMVIDFLDAFSTTKNKTVRSLSGAVTASSRVEINSGVRLSTNAIDSVSIISINLSNELVTGSRFSLYGIKG